MLASSFGFCYLRQLCLPRQAAKAKQAAKATQAEEATQAIQGDKKPQKPKDHPRAKAEKRRFLLKHPPLLTFIYLSIYPSIYLSISGFSTKQYL